MEKIKVRIKKLKENAGIPAYQTPGAAACDLTAAIDGPLTVQPGERALIPTGIAIDFGGEDLAALIFARSGLAVKHGIALSNGVGVIDSDYRGEIKVGIVNQGAEAFTVNPGDRIAQMGFFPVARAEFEVTEELNETERGDGGFGHTGR